MTLNAYLEKMAIFTTNSTQKFLPLNETFDWLIDSSWRNNCIIFLVTSYNSRGYILSKACYWILWSFSSYWWVFSSHNCLVAWLFCATLAHFSAKIGRKGAFGKHMGAFGHNFILAGSTGEWRKFLPYSCDLINHMGGRYT